MKCYCFCMKDGSYQEIYAESMEVSSEGMMGRSAFVLKRGDDIVAEIDRLDASSYQGVEEA